MSDPQKIVSAATPEGRSELKKILDGLKGRIPKRRVHAQHHGVTGESSVIRQTVNVWRLFPVAWAIPMDETMFGIWFTNFMQVQVLPWDDMITTISTYLPNARNICHNRYLNESVAPWLMMLDSDVMPPPDFLQRLLASTKRDPEIKMIGGWYKKKGDGFKPVVYDYHHFEEEIGEHIWKIRQDEGRGIESVDGAGAGCWLMKREVAEAIGEDPYDMVTGGEDLKLCLKVHEAGYETWIDWNLACAHAGVGYA